MIWRIAIGGVELFVVEKKNNKVDIWFIQGFSEVRGGVLWGEVSDIESDTAWHRVIPWKRFLFNCCFLLTYTSFEGQNSLLLKWVNFMIDQCVDPWVSYGLKQGNPLQKFKNHSQLPSLFLTFLLTFISFQCAHSLFLSQASNYRETYLPLC